MKTCDEVTTLLSKYNRSSRANSLRSYQSGNLIEIWGHPRCHEREAEASTPWHRGFRSPLMVWFDRPTARTHRAATRRVGDQAITSPGRCALNLSLRAQIDANDPDVRHEADRYIRPGQFPCSEAGLALRGPSWPHWLRRLSLRAHPVPPPEAEFLIIDFVWDGGLIKIVKPC